MDSKQLRKIAKAIMDEYNEQDLWENRKEAVGATFVIPEEPRRRLPVYCRLCSMQHECRYQLWRNQTIPDRAEFMIDYTHARAIQCEDGSVEMINLNKSPDIFPGDRGYVESREYPKTSLFHYPLDRLIKAKRVRRRHKLVTMRTALIHEQMMRLFGLIMYSMVMAYD